MQIISKEADMKYVLSKLIFVIFVFLPLWSCYQGSVLNERVGIIANNITYIKKYKTIQVQQTNT